MPITALKTSPSTSISENIAPASPHRFQTTASKKAKRAVVPLPLQKNGRLAPLNTEHGPVMATVLGVKRIDTVKQDSPKCVQLILGIEREASESPQQTGVFYPQPGQFLHGLMGYRATEDMQKKMVENVVKATGAARGENAMVIVQDKPHFDLDKPGKLVRLNNRKVWAILFSVVSRSGGDPDIRTPEMRAQAAATAKANGATDAESAAIGEAWNRVLVVDVQVETKQDQTPLKRRQKIAAASKHLLRSAQYYAIKATPFIRPPEEGLRVKDKDVLPARRYLSNLSPGDVAPFMLPNQGAFEGHFAGDLKEPSLEFYSGAAVGEALAIAETINESVEKKNGELGKRKIHVQYRSKDEAYHDERLKELAADKSNNFDFYSYFKANNEFALEKAAHDPELHQFIANMNPSDHPNIKSAGNWSFGHQFITTAFKAAEKTIDPAQADAAQRLQGLKDILSKNYVSEGT